MSMALSAASVFILRTAIWTGGRQEGTPTPPCSSLAARTIVVRGGEEPRRRNHQRASRGLYCREPLLTAIAGMRRPSLPLRSNALSSSGRAGHLCDRSGRLLLHRMAPNRVLD